MYLGSLVNSANIIIEEIRWRVTFANRVLRSPKTLPIENSPPQCEFYRSAWWHILVRKRSTWHKKITTHFLCFKKAYSSQYLAAQIFDNNWYKRFTWSYHLTASHILSLNSTDEMERRGVERHRGRSKNGVENLKKKWE